MTGLIYQHKGRIWLDTQIADRHWLTWKTAVAAFDHWSQVTSRTEENETGPCSGIARRETEEICIWQTDEGWYTFEYVALLEVVRGELSQAIAHRFATHAEVRAWAAGFARPEVAADEAGGLGALWSPDPS